MAQSSLGAGAACELPALPALAVKARARPPLLQLLGYARPHLRYAALTLAFCLGGFFLSFVYPWVLGEVVDAQVFYFKRFHHDIDRSMEPWIEEMAGVMKADPTIKVRLVGHIDDTEKDRQRMRPDMAVLGQKRADTIKAALVEVLQ